MVVVLVEGGGYEAECGDLRTEATGDRWVELGTDEVPLSCWN